MTPINDNKIIEWVIERSYVDGRFRCVLTIGLNGWLSVRVLEPSKQSGSSKTPLEPLGFKTHRGTRCEMRSETDLEERRAFLNRLEGGFRKDL